MILNLKLHIETTKGVFVYEFGTHIKLLKDKLLKVGLSENEILDIKDEVKDSVQKILDKVQK